MENSYSISWIRTSWIKLACLFPLIGIVLFCFHRNAKIQINSWKKILNWQIVWKFWRLRWASLSPSSLLCWEWPPGPVWFCLSLQMVRGGLGPGQSHTNSQGAETRRETRPGRWGGRGGEGGEFTFLNIRTLFNNKPSQSAAPSHLGCER